MGGRALMQAQVILILVTYHSSHCVIPFIYFSLYVKFILLHEERKGSFYPQVCQAYTFTCLWAFVWFLHDLTPLRKTMLLLDVFVKISTVLFRIYEISDSNLDQDISKRTCTIIFTFQWMLRSLFSGCSTIIIR